MRIAWKKLALLTLLSVGCKSSSTSSETCDRGASLGPVSAPVFVRNIPTETSWFTSPIVSDLNHDGVKELIASTGTTLVLDAQGKTLSTGPQGLGRVYAPPVVADLDRDGTEEVVVGRGKNVIAWEWRNNGLQLKAGWPVDTTTGGQAPEVRGLAAADLDGDGTIEVVATTTQTASTAKGGAQVFVYSANGKSYQPAGGHSPAWPRYNALSGAGNDADRNGAGHNGYGAYGLNVGIGQADGDGPLEVAVTYDNHFLQLFNHDGIAIDSAPYFTNPTSAYVGKRLTWGQMIRFADPQVEADHYHEHVGQWPDPSWTEWLQWTQSPPSIVDLDGDGAAEIVAVSNLEKNEPYETQAWAVTVFDGAQGTGARSAMRKMGWEVLPRGETPIKPSGLYPPMGIPAAAIVNLSGTAELEIVVGLNDGFLYALSARAERLWKVDIRHGQKVMFSSEPVVADLNQDGSPEVIVATYGEPNQPGTGHLMVISASGKLLHDLTLPGQLKDGNGTGAAGAPTVGDLDGDGTLEIVVQTFDHGIDIFNVPGSGNQCVSWPTARGSALRQGRAN